MKTVTIILPDSHDTVLTVTVIGLKGHDCNVASHIADLSKGTVIRYDGKEWTQDAEKH